MRRFILVGIELDATLAGEPAVLADMIGTPIDPDLLRAATSVGDALATIAVNTSVVSCALLSALHGQERQGAPARALRLI